MITNELDPDHLLLLSNRALDCRLGSTCLAMASCSCISHSICSFASASSALSDFICCCMPLLSLPEPLLSSPFWMSSASSSGSGSSMFGLPPTSSIFMFS